MSESMNKYFYSKEVIKERMLQNAATIWGVKNARAIDPFVKLLIEAFSTEIFRLSNEVNNISGRMVEKLAHLLTPTQYTMPQPAHALACAFPIEHSCILDKEQEFNHTITVQPAEKGASAQSVYLRFTPVDSVRLNSISVAAIATGYQCQSFDRELNKGVTKRALSRSVPYGELWLALDIQHLPDDVLFPDALAFYFSNPGFEHIEWLYQLLPYAKASIGEHPLQITPGIEYLQDATTQGYEEIFNHHNVQTRIIEGIKDIYRQQFITIKGWARNVREQALSFPESLKQYFHTEDINQILPGKYLWVKLKFPPQYTFEMLEQFSIGLNAFPIINRKWLTKSYVIGPTGNSIPLSPDYGEHFLSVQQIRDNSGRAYQEIPYGSVNNMQAGLYSVRRGGMERFDDRAALDIAGYMLELARDEVSAFSSLIRGDGVNPLKEIVTQIKRMENAATAARSTTREVPSYIVIEPLEATTQINIAYWITNCTLANGLRVTQELKASQGTVTEQHKITLLSNTVGGSLAQRGSDGINAYRYALTSRDRLVTFQDIKNFCLYELRDAIKEIDIKKGIAISHKPKEGFVRTTDIHITVHRYDHYPEHYWHSRQKELLQKIDARAVDGIMRRLFITGENEQQ